MKSKLFIAFLNLTILASGIIILTQIQHPGPAYLYFIVGVLVVTPFILFFSHLGDTRAMRKKIEEQRSEIFTIAMESPIPMKTEAIFHLFWEFYVANRLKKDPGGAAWRAKSLTANFLARQYLQAEDFDTLCNRMVKDMASTTGHGSKIQRSIVSTALEKAEVINHFGALFKGKVAQVVSGKNINEAERLIKLAGESDLLASLRMFENFTKEMADLKELDLST